MGLFSSRCNCSRQGTNSASRCDYCRQDCSRQDCSVKVSRQGAIVLIKAQTVRQGAIVPVKVSRQGVIVLVKTQTVRQGAIAIKLFFSVYDCSSVNRST